MKHTCTPKLFPPRPPTRAACVCSLELPSIDGGRLEYYTYTRTYVHLHKCAGRRHSCRLGQLYTPAFHSNASQPQLPVSLALKHTVASCGCCIPSTVRGMCVFAAKLIVCNALSRRLFAILYDTFMSFFNELKQQ